MKRDNLFKYTGIAIVKSVLTALKFLAPIFVIITICVVLAELLSVLPGADGSLARCVELWKNPKLTVEGLIQNFPHLDMIPFLEDIVNPVLSTANVISGSEAQYTVFGDLYFAVFSSMIIHFVTFLYSIFSFFVKNFYTGLIAKLSSVLPTMGIAYMGTGIAIVMNDWMAIHFFKGHYIIAFFALLFLQTGISFILALFKFRSDDEKPHKLSDIFSHMLKTAFMDLLLQASLYAGLLGGYLILFEKIFDGWSIALFVFCLAAFIYALGRKVQFFIADRKKG